VESILVPGNARPRLPTTGEQLARQNLTAQGDWPQVTGVETVLLEELAGRFRYIYEDRLNDSRPLPEISSPEFVFYIWCAAPLLWRLCIEWFQLLIIGCAAPLFWCAALSRVV